MTVCKVYGLYISDVLQQVEEVMKLFTMEKELRIIKNRRHFPVPKITPQGIKIENTKDKEKVLKAVDQEVCEILRAIRQNKENYKKEKEEAKNKKQQVKLKRQTNRSDFNFLTMSSSTPIRNNNTGTHTRPNQHKQTETAVHFDPNTIMLCLPPIDMTSNNGRYKPPVNNSIIQGAGSAPDDQLATNTTGVTSHNKPWRYNNGTNPPTCTNLQTCMSRSLSRNSFHNSPNSSDNRNGPTCFKCGD